MTLAHQINSQLQPSSTRRHVGRAGVGQNLINSPGTISACSSATVGIATGGASTASLPTYILEGLFQTTSWGWMVLLTNTSNQDYSLPDSFDGYKVVQFMSSGTTYKGPTGSPCGPPVTIPSISGACPPGTVGKVVNGQFVCTPIPVTIPSISGACPPGSVGDVVNGQFVCRPIAVVHIPGNVGATGNFTATTGHRIQVTVKAAGVLPNSYGSASSPLTAALLAANNFGVLALGPGNFVISGAPTYPDASTLVVMVDYCGPTEQLAQGGTVTVGGVAVTTTFADQGPSPAGICPAPAAASSKTPYYVAGGVAAAALAAGAWWKYGRKKKR